MTVYTCAFEDYTTLVFRSLAKLHAFIEQEGHLYDQGETRITKAYLRSKMKAGETIRCCQEGEDEWSTRVESHKV